MDAKAVIISAIVICAGVLVAYAMTIDWEPQKILTICDESHREKYTYFTSQRIGDVTVSVPKIGYKTVCDKSHEQMNPKWIEWSNRQPRP